MKALCTLFIGLLAANAVASQDVTPAAGTPPVPAAAPTAASASTAPSGTVARAQFTTGIQDREPADELTALSNDKTEVFFFTELKNMAGGKITHRWEHDGKVMAEKSFDVDGNRWRVWSSKQLDPNWTGEWKVTVVDANGTTLATDTLSYNAAPAPQPSAPPTEAAPKQNN